MYQVPVLADLSKTEAFDSLEGEAMSADENAPFLILYENTFLIIPSTKYVIWTKQAYLQENSEKKDLEEKIKKDLHSLLPEEGRTLASRRIAGRKLNKERRPSHYVQMSMSAQNIKADEYYYSPMDSIHRSLSVKSQERAPMEVRL
ncbi:316_t:CDS:2 [Paraglomus occultum]|uniref:316_t:CDS:1 n=1 Tax=Paraglomus occultum TaxID=144539 RepID=A0A9N8WK93_9GLOM|nr:316_t:CDS:2 [Paraglomus occultum]